MIPKHSLKFQITKPVIPQKFSIVNTYDSTLTLIVRWQMLSLTITTMTLIGLYNLNFQRWKREVHHWNVISISEGLFTWVFYTVILIYRRNQWINLDWALADKDSNSHNSYLLLGSTTQSSNVTSPPSPMPCPLTQIDPLFHIDPIGH